MAQINLNSIARTVEKFMTDTVTIQRRTGNVLNEITLQSSPSYETVYTGKAFIAPMGDPAGTTLGGENVQRIQYEIGVPRTSAEILPNDVVTVDVSADASLISAGSTFYVHDQIPTTFLTHRRIKVFKDTSAV